MWTLVSSFWNLDQHFTSYGGKTARLKKKKKRSLNVDTTSLLIDDYIHDNIMLDEIHYAKIKLQLMKVTLFCDC